MCSPQTAREFSAVGFFFGQRLRAELGVPIGLINVSLGYTAEDIKRGVSMRKGEGGNQVTVLFNGMIAPLTPLAIKGAIWYQGESNAYWPAQYRALLPALIRDWRARFSAGAFPFLIVQLANYAEPKDQPAKSWWAELREAQRDRRRDGKRRTPVPCHVGSLVPPRGARHSQADHRVGALADLPAMQGRRA